MVLPHKRTSQVRSLNSEPRVSPDGFFWWFSRTKEWVKSEVLTPKQGFLLMGSSGGSPNQKNESQRVVFHCPSLMTRKSKRNLPGYRMERTMGCFDDSPKQKESYKVWFFIVHFSWQRKKQSKSPTLQHGENKVQAIAEKMIELIDSFQVKVQQLFTQLVSRLTAITVGND